MEALNPDPQRGIEELNAIQAALQRAQAVIEFDMNGVILHANDNFLNTLGYTLDEVAGKHHRIFCDPEYAASPAYAAFWAKLKRGEYDHGEYRRLGKYGREVWIQASYNPVFDTAGQPYKVVKFATDVSDLKRRSAEYEGKIAAIDKAQAVIEFNLDGTVIGANPNFLEVIGYALDEIVGEHHRMFCPPEYAQSVEYRRFWQKLNRGEFDANRYRRIGKGGKTVWIQATYNPILDASGRPSKVVKFATDVTAQVELEAAIQHKAESDAAKVAQLLEAVQRAAQGDLSAQIAVAARNRSTCSPRGSVR